MHKKNRGSGSGEGIAFVLIVGALFIAFIFYRWAKSLGVDVDILFRSTVISLVILAGYIWYLFKFEFRSFLTATSCCAALVWPFWWPVLINKCNNSLPDFIWDDQVCNAWYASNWLLGGVEIGLIVLAVWLYRNDRR